MNQQRQILASAEALCETPALRGCCFNLLCHRTPTPTRSNSNSAQNDKLPKHRNHGTRSASMKSLLGTQSADGCRSPGKPFFGTRVHIVKPKDIDPSQRLNTHQRNSACRTLRLLSDRGSAGAEFISPEIPLPHKQGPGIVTLYGADSIDVRQTILIYTYIYVCIYEAISTYTSLKLPNDLLRQKLPFFIRAVRISILTICFGP